MQISQLLLLGLFFVATNAWAQTSSLDTVKNQVPQSSKNSIRSNDYGGGSSYDSHASFDGMGSLGVPEYKAAPPDLSYIGVLGEKWETDKRGRRSSFVHQGVEMSISRGLQSSSAKARTDTIPERKRDALTPIYYPPKH